MPSKVILGDYFIGQPLSQHLRPLLGLFSLEKLTNHFGKVKSNREL